jgi:hypothetical protein
MTKHKTGTRQEWLAARLELLKVEKDLTRRSDMVTRQRLELPWVRIDKEYRFETDEGSASRLWDDEHIRDEKMPKEERLFARSIVRHKNPSRTPLFNAMGSVTRRVVDNLT